MGVMDYAPHSIVEPNPISPGVHKRRILDLVNAKLARSVTYVQVGSYTVGDSAMAHGRTGNHHEYRASQEPSMTRPSQICSLLSFFLPFRSRFTSFLHWSHAQCHRIGCLGPMIDASASEGILEVASGKSDVEEPKREWKRV